MDTPVPLPPRHRSWVRFLIGVPAAFVLAFLLYIGVLVVRGVPEQAPLASSDRFTSTGQTAAVTAVDKTRLVRNTSVSLGSPTATVQIVEFVDFECPYCRESFPIIRALAAEYGDRIHYVWRNFPIVSLHPQSIAAAEAAACANEQGKFWAYHDRLFQNQEQLTSESLRAYALSVGVTLPAFDRCVSERRYQQFIRDDMADGQALGVRGTPTWFINGVKVEGTIPADNFRQVIEELLAEK